MATKRTEPSNSANRQENKGLHVFVSENYLSLHVYRVVFDVASKSSYRVDLKSRSCQPTCESSAFAVRKAQVTQGASRVKFHRKITAVT